MALEEHLDGEEQWAVVYGCGAWGRDLGRARSQVELGGWGGVGQPSEKDAEGREQRAGHGAVVSVATFVSVEPSLA